MVKTIEQIQEKLDSDSAIVLTADELKTKLIKNRKKLQ